jgi:hypothetical protein
MGQAKGKMKGKISATITRADGTVEELGVISTFGRQSLKARIANKIRRLFKWLEY